MQPTTNPSGAPVTLLCQSSPAAERATAVLAALDALGPQESFLLVSDHPQASLLALLQRERPGRFEWSPVETGPETWRTEVTRRSGRPQREIAEALSWDHDRLADLEREAFLARSLRRYEAAGEVYGRFARGLRRHIGFEEELLFHEFEDRSGLSPEAGPTAVMREEHRLIERLLAEIERGITDPVCPVEGLRRELRQLLDTHHTKEEQVLYPGTDRLLSAEERDELVCRIQAYAG